MSVAALSWATAHSGESGVDKLVLMACADAVGSGTFDVEDEHQVSLVCSWADLDEETVRAAIRRLMARGTLASMAEAKNPPQLQRDQRRRPVVPRLLRDAVLMRYGFRCQLCGGEITDPATLHIDHRVPISRGGLTTIDNLQPAHASCNIAKGGR